MKQQEWEAEGRRRFGKDKMRWKFVCPSCGHIATVQDWKDAGASRGQFAFSCIGRSLGTTKEMGERPGPCNYAGGGLFAINPVEVDGGHYFAFAEPEPKK